MSDHTIEIYKTLRESQNKYTYFLLAASAAGIGLGLQQTNGVPISNSQLPLLIAGLLWGASFFCGCKHIAFVNSSLYANIELLQLEKIGHTELKGKIQLEAASEGIKEAIESNSNWANRLGHWQFRLLILGAFFYIIWHIVEMYQAGFK